MTGAWRSPWLCGYDLMISQNTPYGSKFGRGVLALVSNPNIEDGWIRISELTPYPDFEVGSFESEVPELDLAWTFFIG
jgi:hypothetical protein